MDTLDQDSQDARLEAIELPLLVEAVYQYYGYDFRDYSSASFKRRVRRAMQIEQIQTISAFQDRVLHDRECMARFLDAISVDVTAMFRDPAFYKALRDKVLPCFRAHPHLRCWIAGCATGEEVYSLAIVLHEAGLLDQTRLYATDINQRVLEQGKQAIFPIKNMRQYTDNYLKAGGQGNFSDYYTAKYEHVIVRDFLCKNIVWAGHNLVSDTSFNEFEFEIVLCRNVMIYFNRKLQERVLGLLHDSLAMQGVLGLGRAESLQTTSFARRYEVIDRVEKLYRKTS